MPFPARLVTQFIALAMLIVWTYLALHYVACAARGTALRAVWYGVLALLCIEIALFLAHYVEWHKACRDIL